MHRFFPGCAAAVATLFVAACGSSPATRTVAHTVRPTSPAATAATRVHSPALYPLTGLPVHDRALAHRPAISIKIDNVADALPQQGLNNADLVTDVLVEGGLTRLLATFQSQDASVVGPIRSARPVDADLLRELNGGVFVYSGAAPGEIAPSIDHSTALLLSDEHQPQWFVRTSRPAPHNLFASTAQLAHAAHVLRPRLASPPQLFRYATHAPAARHAHSLLVHFSGYSSAGWTWDGSRYLRSQNGVPDTLADGSRISSTNVVVLAVTWHPTHIIDAAGNADPYVVVTGSGRAWVFRDGRVVTGHWVRPSYRTPVRILDGKGKQIPLRPGRTWLELQPPGFTPAYH